MTCIVPAAECSDPGPLDTALFLAVTDDSADHGRMVVTRDRASGAVLQPVTRAWALSQ